MTVKELKKFLESVDEKALVLVPAFDHSYRSNVGVENTTALVGLKGYIYEDHGDEYKDRKADKRVQVLVIT